MSPSRKMNIDFIHAVSPAFRLLSLCLKNRQNVTVHWSGQWGGERPNTPRKCMYIIMLTTWKSSFLLQTVNPLSASSSSAIRFHDLGQNCYSLEMKFSALYTLHHSNRNYCVKFFSFISCFSIVKLYYMYIVSSFTIFKRPLSCYTVFIPKLIFLNFFMNKTCCKQS